MCCWLGHILYMYLLAGMYHGLVGSDIHVASYPCGLYSLAIDPVPSGCMATHGVSLSGAAHILFSTTREVAFVLPLISTCI